MNQPPDNITIVIRVNEPVGEFCKRVFLEAARVVGLPVTEQNLFAEALIQQYPRLARAAWQRDPTPRDGTADVQQQDFNFLLLRQYLNLHPGAGRRIVSLKQIETVVGRATTVYALDEITKEELRRWQQDFVYRGGVLGSGLDAPVSRSGLVPALQSPAETPDITWIPRIMRSRNLNKGAILMEEWFRRAANVRPARLEDTPDNFGPPMIGVITMDWVLGFTRTRAAYNRLINGKMWLTPNARREIGAMLLRVGVLAQARARAGQAVPFGDLASSNVLAVEAVHVQFSTFNESWIDNTEDYLFETYDDLTAALANFTFHLAVKGSARWADEALQVTIEEVGVYVKDSYDFLNKPGENQRLGVWGEGVGSVTNDHFNRWRTANNRGGDFLVYSDIKTTRLTPPDSFPVLYR